MARVRLGFAVVLLVVAACAAPTPTIVPRTSATLEPAATLRSELPPSARAGAFDFGAPEVVATGLDVPWGLAFLADGTALVSERETGRILRLVPGQPAVEVARIAGAGTGGEGGLLGLAIAPGGDGWIYAMDSRPPETRIVRFRLGGEPEVVLGEIPGNAFHTGGRLAFGPDGKLYAAVGDATIAAAAQDGGSLAGKILRLEADGSVPADNPDPSSPVWSLGHRNVEGLAWDDAGRLWASEFGESTADELNRIEPGANYGWPGVEGTGGEPVFVDPLVTWSPSEASPAGLAFADGSLYVAALRGERLWRVPVGADGGLGQPETLLEGVFGRLRTIELAPDGWLWIATSNRDGRGREPRADDDLVVRFPPLPNGSG